MTIKNISTNLSRILSALVVMGLVACSSMSNTNSGLLTTHSQSQLIVGAGIEVSWLVQDENNINDEERISLIRHLETKLQHAFDTEQLNPYKASVQVRAAITRIETVSPTLNWLSTLLLFVPLDRGGAAVEFEAIDIKTKTSIIQMSFAEWTPLAKLKAHYNSFAPAELALASAAKKFADSVELNLENGITPSKQPAEDSLTNKSFEPT